MVFFSLQMNVRLVIFDRPWAPPSKSPPGQHFWCPRGSQNIQNIISHRWSCWLVLWVRERFLIPTELPSAQSCRGKEHDIRTFYSQVMSWCINCSLVLLDWQDFCHPADKNVLIITEGFMRTYDEPRTGTVELIWTSIKQQLLTYMPHWLNKQQRFLFQQEKRHSTVLRRILNWAKVFELKQHTALWYECSKQLVECKGNMRVWKLRQVAFLELIMMASHSDT
jgi:hypothetical protein